MPDFIVSIDEQESNPLANNLSLAGRVNDIPVAIVIKLSNLKGMNEAQQKVAKQRALIAAYTSRQESPLPGTGEKVTI